MKLFVANLNFRYRTEELAAQFANYGTVTNANIVTDRETGRSRGFGFVEMENDDEARAAIAALNGAEIGGRPVVVKEAEERERRPMGAGGGGGGGRPSFRREPRY